MSLSNSYYQNIKRLPDFFSRIRDANVPEQVTQQLIRDWGFTSSNDRSLIPLLKNLGFLTSEGRPTSRYQDYRDHSRSKKVLGEALKESYSELFLIKANPKPTDRDAIQGKFKSYHNTSDLVSGHMTKTFYALLDLADISEAPEASRKDEKRATPALPAPQEESESRPGLSGLHYNIQIHLPATKDVEVYNAIFKSLKEHLIE